MSVKIQIELSQARYEQAKAMAEAEHMPVEDLVFLWAELGREALNHPELTVPFLEVALKSELELLDDDCPPREIVGRLWAAMGKDRQRCE